MRRTLATETLKTGETLEVECVFPPDEERAEQIRPFLAHKPPNYGAHIEAALAGQCDALETRFYIGLLNGEMVGNVMTVESRGVGIFGHVNTRQDQRRKGICRHILRYQMEDFRQRGGHVLLLGTGYESPPFWIYHSFGFRQREGGHPGFMRYVTPDYADFEAQSFSGNPSRPVKAAWRHWPLVAWLASLEAPAYLRSLTLDVWGVSLLEGPYCKFLYQYGQNPRAAAAVLETEGGIVTGVATCVPDARWRGDVALLDVFAHPTTSEKDLTELLHSLPLPSGKTQCYADARDAQKIAALESVGFRQEALLPGQFQEGESWRDVRLYARR